MLAQLVFQLLVGFLALPLPGHLAGHKSRWRFLAGVPHLQVLLSQMKMVEMVTLGQLGTYETGRA